MRIRSRIAAGIIATTMTGGVFALTGGAAMATTVSANTPPTMATTVACKTTVTHAHSVSAKGTVSGHTLVKRACGKNYTETENGFSNSYTGATSVYTWTKVENYPCWTKVQVRHSVSKIGTVSNTRTATSGGC
jgi:hypothetical protein